MSHNLTHSNSLDLFTGTSADPNPATTITSDRTIFEMKFNQVKYEVELWLDNGGGDSDQNRLPINPNAVINLTINETLADWSTGGTLTILYVPENNRSSSNTGSSEVSYSNYVFRNDGLDLLRVRMRPLVNPTNGNGYSADGDPVFWTLSYLFSIYDREEIDMPSGEQNAATNKFKALKLYFWDSWFQRLNTRILQFSTALSVSPAPTIDPTLDNGTQGVLKTGQVIKQIFDLGLSETPNQASYTGNSLPDSSISPRGVPMSNVSKDIGADFDIGSANIFYTAPAFTTAYDSLMYVYSKHVSSAQIASSSGAQPPRGGRDFSNQIFDFCILSKEKGPEPESIGQLTLKPMSTYFEKAGNSASEPGEYQIEHFWLQSYFDADTPGAILKAPTSNRGSSNIDISSPGYSFISNYRFVDIAALINSKEFCNRPVYSFDFRARVMNIEYANNNVETARKFIAEKYISKVYKRGGNNEDLFLITLETEKKDRNFKPTFSLDGDNPKLRQNVGLQKLLKLGVFENAAVNFRTPGLPFREPGRFIAIDKLDGAESGEFEDKFYGQWFIIDIKHIFEAEVYYNEITAVKVHRFDTLPISLPGTI